MVEDDLDFSKSHWDDALSNSSIHESLGPDNQSKGDADDRNEELNDSEVSSEPLKSTDNNTTQSPNLPASRQKHHRITTLRSSRFNKKVAPKVHIEAVSSSNPLGPLGAATAETDSSSTSRTRSFGDKTVLSGINHYNANNERLALFGDDKVESPNNLSSGRSEVSSSIGTKGTTNEDSFDTSGSSHFKDLSLNDGGNNPQSLTDSNATKQIDPSRFDPSSTTQTGPQLNTFEITVGDPIKVGDITSAHIVYTVHTKTNSPNFSSVETSVTRRYKDFRWLYHALENNNPGIIIPPPPEKQAVGRFDEDFVESRRAALENMLNKCANHNSLQSDPDFRIFLESETFSTDIKSKQYQSQTSSVSNGSESKGFMGSLGGAFSFSGKFVETDEWFLEKKTYVDSLESQFKYLEKSLDAVVAQRKELSDATAEFANILGSLSQVELSKSFGELVERFSQVELRVRDLYYRQCMQDILSLGTTLEEYIRLISSIRNVFAHRQKAYFTMQVAEQDLYKKRNHLEKVMKQGKTLQDKIAVLKQDVSDQEKKVINLRVAFDDISKLIISEFARFEASKAHDFRNSVELYLENAVEAQKKQLRFGKHSTNLAALYLPIRIIANLVIQDTVERIYINQQTFGETSRGVFIVRGENVVYVGELDENLEEQEDALIIDSETSEANLSPFPKLSPGALLADRQQQKFQQQQQLERNPETGLPVIRRIPFQDAERIFNETSKTTLDAHVKQRASLPNAKFDDLTVFVKY